MQKKKKIDFRSWIVWEGEISSHGLCQKQYKKLELKGLGKLFKRNVFPSFPLTNYDDSTRFGKRNFNSWKKKWRKKNKTLFERNCKNAVKPHHYTPQLDTNRAPNKAKTKLLLEFKRQAELAFQSSINFEERQGSNQS